MNFPSCTTFKTKCKQNNGYNILTYSLLLTLCTTLMFLTSVILTHVNYNRTPYRDWALVGGVTPTSAQFRVRGPKHDDGIARQFVVSVNANLALERDQILVTPVSHGDFLEEEHFFKKISLGGLTPLRQYYFGIVRPQRTPNSATMAGDVGTFATPAPVGTRMNFTIAAGSCALTGSQSNMFATVLDLNPLMFVHMGDFHYEDLSTLDIDQRLEAYDKVMGSALQRLLYMRTIFTYMWDDHDWLGNNEDAQNVEAADVAKRGYSIAIPHYPLAAVESGYASAEETAPKYQAFTIGTVRFVITDLRSESEKSTEDSSGKTYSDEQKEWLYNELAQAENYDFVVWVSTRPWTEPEEIGGDSWGGFVSDRDDLSAHIASTIGAGPKNLLVLSGDNHMVAFDDGSSTDFSGQDEFPGGFPVFHSGPLTNFGSGVKSFFAPSDHYFTDGCMAFNSEVNYQFGTVEFEFPSDEVVESGSRPCVILKSYADNSANLIFTKRLCAGEMMREGTTESDTCTLPRLSDTTFYMFVAALAVIGVYGILSLWYLGLKKCILALEYFGIGLLFFLLNLMAAVAGAFCFGTLGVDVFSIAIFTLTQAILGSVFVGLALRGYYASIQEEEKGVQLQDEVKISVANEAEAGETVDNSQRNYLEEEVEVVVVNPTDHDPAEQATERSNSNNRKRTPRNGFPDATSVYSM